jgi:protoporphyrinogen oxidase
MDAKARDAAAKLAYNSLTTVAVGLKHDRLPEYSWVYLPQPDQGPANRITYLTNYSKSLAPEGQGLILAEATCKGEPRKDAAYVDEVVSGLETAGLLKKGDVALTHASAVKYAYVVFDLDFRRKIAAALAGVEALGMETLGRFGRFEYVNSDHCVAKAFELGRRMAAESKRGVRA